MTKTAVPRTIATLHQQITELQATYLWIVDAYVNATNSAPGIAAQVYDGSPGGNSSDTPTERAALRPTQRNDHQAINTAAEQATTALRTLTDLLHHNKPRTPDMVQKNFCSKCDGQLGESGRCLTCGQHKDTSTCSNCGDPIPARQKRCGPCRLTYRNTGSERITTNHLNLNDKVKIDG